MKKHICSDIAKEVYLGTITVNDAARACRLTRRSVVKLVRDYCEQAGLPLRYGMTREEDHLSRTHEVLRARVFGG